MKKRNTEGGQALILIAFTIIGLVGLTGLTVDGGLAYSDRRNAQNAADNSAMAGARSKVRNGSWKADADNLANLNGYPDTDPGSTSTSTRSNIEVYTCAETGNTCPEPYAGKSNYLQVIITSNVNTLFAPIVGVRSVTNKVYSIANASPGQSGPLYGGGAMVGLKQNVTCKPDGSPTSGDTPSLNFTGSTHLETYYGGLFSNSKDPCSMAFAASGQYIETHTTDHCDSGLYTAATGYYTQANPTIKLDCNSVHYNAEQQVIPPPNLPNPVCDTNATWSGTNMYPGNYSGQFPPSGVTTLQSGVYCINSGNFYLNSNSQLRGDGVLIVLNNGVVDWQGSPLVNLSSPNEGVYKGLLFFSPWSVTGTSTLQGSTGSTLSGTILLPHQDIVLTGGYKFSRTLSQFIGYTLTMTGNSTVVIEAIPDLQYVPPVPPMVNLAK